MAIAVFAGHVGKDSGAIDGIGTNDDLYTIEAEITMAIAHKICMYLELMGIEYRLLAGSFESRIRMSAGCECGVSIHADVSVDEATNGYHVVYYPKSTRGKALAMAVDSSLFSTTKRARQGHSDGHLAILRDTAFPCVIVETGFLSNPIEESELYQPHYQYRLAFGIVDGVRRWLGHP
jgi:N-acetylmuramoyl-L-alanine amidase